MAFVLVSFSVNLPMPCCAIETKNWTMKLKDNLHLNRHKKSVRLCLKVSGREHASNEQLE